MGGQFDRKCRVRGSQMRQFCRKVTHLANICRRRYWENLLHMAACGSIVLPRSVTPAASQPTSIWDRFYMAAPRRFSRSVQRYSGVKRVQGRWRGAIQSDRRRFRSGERGKQLRTSPWGRPSRILRFSVSTRKAMSEKNSTPKRMLTRLSLPVKAVHQAAPS